MAGRPVGGFSELPDATLNRLWHLQVGHNHPQPVAGGHLERAEGRLLSSKGEWINIDMVDPQRLPFEPEAGHWEGLPAEAELFTDGSMQQSAWPGSRRAGWGVVVTDGHDRHIFTACGPVPHPLPQTAPMAEWLAAMVAAQLWHSRCAMPIGDCLQVVRACGLPDPAPFLLRGSVSSTYLRMVIQFFNGIMPMEKVKSHQDIADLPAGRLRRLAVGNDLADAMAKRGASIHPAPSPVELETAGRIWRLLSADLPRAMASICMAWPGEGRFVWGGRSVGGVGRSGRRKRQLVEPVDRHHFTPMGGHMICGRCMRRVSHGRVGWTVAYDRCPGTSSVLTAALDGANRGHVLVLASFSGKPCIVCIRCGSYSGFMIRGGMAGDCKAPTARGKQNLSRLSRSLHPDPRLHGLRGEAFFRLLASGLEEFSP